MKRSSPVREFRSLAELLRPSEPVLAAVTAPADAEPETAVAPDEETLREVRLFRAHLRESLDRAVENLLERIARDVFARELLLAPGEIAALVDGALARYTSEEPLRVRVHPEDVEKIEQLDAAIFSDESLERGDVCVDLRNGTLDLRLRSRLESVMAAVQQP